MSVLIITHKLREARQVADRMTVMRGGRSVVEGVHPETLDDTELVHAMVGRAVPPLSVKRGAASQTDPALEMTAIHVPGDGGTPGLRDLHLTVGRGEVIGIAGVAGSGQRELAEAIAGALAWSEGTICVDGLELPRADPLAAMRAGVAYVPEDPVEQWVVPGLTIAENVAFAAMKIGRASCRERV